DDASLVKAMKVAFEDQLVQKVMPKLRGIETRGKSKSDCLDKIKNQLGDYTIIEDFELACEFGYGQFIWNSANYLKDDEAVNGQENAEN
ncbi:MAG: chromosome partitioning protein ParA, partial [Fibrobacter sp.]|nr:chromosome partitioning protein ParA [Fibrobacter sp.]